MSSKLLQDANLMAATAAKQLPDSIRKLNVTATLGSLAYDALKHEETVTVEDLCRIAEYSLNFSASDPIEWLRMFAFLRRKNVGTTQRAPLTDINGLKAEFKLRLIAHHKATAAASDADANTDVQPPATHPESAPASPAPAALQSSAQQLQQATLLARQAAAQGFGADKKVEAAMISLAYHDSHATIDSLIASYRQLGTSNVEVLNKLRKKKYAIAKGTLADPQSLLVELGALQQKYLSNRAQTTPQEPAASKPTQELANSAPNIPLPVAKPPHVASVEPTTVVHASPQNLPPIKPFPSQEPQVTEVAPTEKKVAVKLESSVDVSKHTQPSVVNDKLKNVPAAARKLFEQPLPPAEKIKISGVKTPATPQPVVHLPPAEDPFAIFEPALEEASPTAPVNVMDPDEFLRLFENTEAGTPPIPDDLEIPNPEDEQL